MTAPASFQCQTCGAMFSLPAKVAERYPDWTPPQCRDCRDGSQVPSRRPASSRSGGPAADNRQAGKAQAADRRPARRRARSAAVEENLPIAEVLAKYTGGPADGVFTDGSVHPNPGPGGWGAVYVVGGEVIDQAYGSDPSITTNNRMELTALIAGYDLVPPGTPATVYSDSELCVKTITQYAPAWERNGWTRKTGPIANLDLVQRLYTKAKARPELRLQWIRAHDGSRWNEYADSLSTAYRRERL